MARLPLSLAMLGCLAGGGIGPAALAQPVVPVGGVFQVNTYTTNSQARPAVAMDADGDFVVVWHSRSQDGSPTHEGVFGRRYDSAGAALGPEFQVNSYTTYHQRYPAIAMETDGDFVVVWQSQLQDGGNVEGVFGQRFDSAGTPLNGEFQVNTFTSGSQLYAKVAMDADGDFVVVWQSYHDGASTRPARRRARRS